MVWAILQPFGLLEAIEVSLWGCLGKGLPIFVSKATNGSHAILALFNVDLEEEFSLFKLENLIFSGCMLASA